MKTLAMEQPMDDDKRPTNREVIELTDQLRRVLQGKRPVLQGMALAEVLAIYLAVHPPIVREEAFELIIAAVLDMIPICEALIHARHREPN